MKKLAIFIVIAAVMILSACTGSREATLPEFLSAPYTFTADFTMDSLAGRLIFTRYGPEEIMLEYLAPDTLADMVITIRAGEFILNYRDISSYGLLDNLARTHPAAVLYGLLSGFLTPAKVSAGQTPGHTVFVFEDGSLTASDTALVSIHAPDYGLSLSVTEFRPLA